MNVCHNNKISEAKEKNISKNLYINIINENIIFLLDNKTIKYKIDKYKRFNKLYPKHFMHIWPNLIIIIKNDAFGEFRSNMH